VRARGPPAADPAVGAGGIRRGRRPGSRVAPVTHPDLVSLNLTGAAAA